MKQLNWVSALFLVAALCGCKPEKTITATTEKSDGPQPAESAKLRTFIDETVNPSDDFFSYVNGVWVNQTEIPGDRGRWGSFDELRDRNDSVVNNLYDKAAEMKFDKGSDEWKALTLYQISMDTNSIESFGLKPLKPYFNNILALTSKPDLQILLEEMAAEGSGLPFAPSVFNDLQNSSRYAAYIWQGGLSLPDRDYYLKDQFADKRKAYKEHIEKMFELASVRTEPGVADRILDFETKLAESTMERAAQRNTDTLYNPMTIREIEQIAPDFDWNHYFQRIGMTSDTIIVGMPEFIKRFDQLFKDESLLAWQDYLRWQIIQSAAPYGPKALADESFNFTGKVLNGLEEQSPRWKRMQRMVNNIMGEAIGKVYVKEMFPPEAKAEAERLVNNLILAFDDRLASLDWMTPETKINAKKKLDAFTVKIGYPDKWKDYSHITIDPEKSLLENLTMVGRAEFTKMMRKQGEEVDREEWGMTPQTVNAYYSPLNNEIVFPAAILQPPFYDYKADAAVNYGGIGAVIGHEITHGFDDQGSRFDAEGNLSNWWSDSDRDEFTKRATMLVDQYAAYMPLPETYVNGKLTLGENIADLGGITMAYYALQKELAKNGNPGLIEGLTPEQRFFMNWARVWRIKYRDDALTNLIKVDSHSPGMYRANGPVSNFEPFFDAFKIKDNSAMKRSEEDRVIIW